MTEKGIRGGVFVIKDNQVFLRYKTKQVPSKEDYKYLEVEKLGYTKTIEGVVCYKREAMSPRSLKMYEAYFMRRIRISVPKRKKFRFVYLKVSEPIGTERGTELLHIRFFGSNRSMSLTFKEAEELDFSVKLIGKEQRISKAKVKQLEWQPDFLGFYRTDRLEQALIEI